LKSPRSFFASGFLFPESLLRGKVASCIATSFGRIR
jgi:hypothetical protein